jgi:serine/threonine protein kinase
LDFPAEMADPDGHGAAEMDQAHEDDPNDFSSPITTDDDDDDIVDHMGQTELLEVKLDTEQFRGSFHIPLGYDPSTLSMLGGGSFGSVAKVDFVDEQPHSIAIKKLTRPFQDVIFALRTAREMRVLKHLQGCESNNIVAYVGAYTPDTLDSLNQVYVVVEAMDMDLRKAFRSQLTEEHVRYIMYQVCNGLRYLHSAGILHRDLKPENIAISSNASVRLIDMGLCRTQHRIKDTPYVQTRFYRAPEVICMTEYDYSSDW